MLIMGVHQYWMFIVVLLFVVTTISANTPPPTPIEDRVEDVVQAVMACRRLPGLSVAFVRVGEDAAESVFSRAYGWADAGARRNATRTTRFCLAGATQPFTAAALLKVLRDNATFTLDSPVHHILPNFKLHDKPTTHQLTLRDILAHRAGLAPYFGGLLLGYNLTRAEIVRRLRFVPSVAPFRHSALPNPLLYVLAGQLIQEMSGTTWEEVVNQSFFKPNQMLKSTFADKVSRWWDDFALPHALRNGELTTLSYKVTGNVLRPVGPAASVCTSSDDMVKWLQFLLRNGTNTTGSSILHPKDIDEMFNASNSNLKRNSNRGAQGALPVDSTVTAYTLGWITGTYRGHRRLFINGFANSYGAFVSLLPDLGIGIFTAANGPSLAAMDNAFRSLHYWLTDLALEKEPWLDRKSVCSFPRPWLKPTAPRYKKKFSTQPPRKTTPDITKITHGNYKTTLPTTENTFAHRITSSAPENNASSLSRITDDMQKTTSSLEARTEDYPEPENNSALPAKSTILKHTPIIRKKTTLPIYDTTSVATTVQFAESSDSPETSTIVPETSFSTLTSDFTETLLDTGTSTFSEITSDDSGTSTFSETTSDDSGTSTFSETTSDDSGTSTFSETTSDGSGTSTFSETTSGDSGTSKFSETTSDDPETTDFSDMTSLSAEITDFTETLLDHKTSNFPDVSHTPETSNSTDLSSHITVRTSFPATSSSITKTSNLRETTLVPETYYFPEAATIGHEAYYFSDIASLGPETFYFPETATLSPETYYFLEMTRLPKTTQFPKVTRFHKNTSHNPKTSLLTETTTISLKTTQISKATNFRKRPSSPKVSYFPETSSISPETSRISKITSLNPKSSHFPKTTPSPLESSTASFGSRISSLASHKPLKKHGSSNKLATSTTILMTDSTWQSQEASSSTLNQITQQPWDDTTLEELVVDNTNTPVSTRRNLQAPAYNILDQLVRAAAAALRRPPAAVRTTQPLPRTSPTMPWGARLMVTTWSPRRKHLFQHLTRQRITKRPHLSLSLANRRRQRRQAATAVNQFPQHVGTYSHPFFGDLVISFNRTAGTLQMDYGFYGKAHLLPKRGNRLFVLHFFSALWYVSDSDDSRRLPLRLFVMQFESATAEAPPDNVTIPLFEPRAPPVFKRISSS